jgi:hypothetical protein
MVFVLGPPQTLGVVFGLIDEECGWPHPIQLSEVKTLSDLMPSHRRHPVIWRGADWLAISINLGEYELVKRNRAVADEGGDAADRPFN